jgi:hypothetical protein
VTSYARITERLSTRLTILEGRTSGVEVVVVARTRVSIAAIRLAIGIGVAAPADALQTKTIRPDSYQCHYTHSSSW